MRTPLLRVRDLRITHAGAERPTPDRVSFEVRPGEVVLVLGPSGSGKSTLTLALNGLVPQAIPVAMSGTVEVGGLDAAAASVARLSEQVAMVFQDPDAQLVTGTVLDEVAFALENLLLPVDEVLGRTEEALRRVGLWERRADNPDALSGGGRQRLAIACALAMASPLIVLDEPTANLDGCGIDEVYAALGELVASGDRAVVLVEHNLDAAMSFATRVIVLDQHGRLAFDGPVREVLLGRTAELLAMGVWLPGATLAALRLRDAGVGIDPLPLTPAELSAALRDVAPSRSPREDMRRTTEPRRDDHPSDGVSSRFAQSRTETDGDEEPLIRARGLSVRKGRTPVLHDVHLEIDEGEFVAFVGPNGAGKTTLIQALAGVIAPPRGQVSVCDLDPATASPRELAARIGFVFQNPEHQFIAHTVFDELAHGLRLRRLPPEEVTARVDEMLVRFGLEDKAQSHPFLLSGGQKRRLSVGTALITRPRVLALDEPTFGQDRSRATELLALLSEIRDAGTTVLIVAHDLQLVADYATRTVILDRGRIHAAGATEELFASEELFEQVGLRLPAVHRALPVPLRGIRMGVTA